MPRGEGGGDAPKPDPIDTRAAGYLPPADNGGDTDPFIGRVRDERRAFAQTAVLLRGLTSKRILPPNESTDQAIQPPGIEPRPDEIPLKAADMHRRIEEFPGKIEELHASTRDALKTTLPEIRRQIEELDLSSVEDIHKLNELVRQADAALQLAGHQYGVSLSGHQEKERLQEIHRQKALEEAGIDLSSGVDSAFDLVDQAKLDRLAELRDARGGWRRPWRRITNRGQIKFHSAESDRLGELAKLRHKKYIFLPYTSSYDVEEPTDKAITGVVNDVVSKVMERQNALLVEAKTPSIVPPEGASGLVSQQALDTLNDQYIQTVVMAELEKERRDAGTYGREDVVQELNNPERFAEIVGILKEAYAAQPPDYFGRRYETRDQPEPNYRTQINEMPPNLQTVVNRLTQYDGGQNARFQYMAKWAEKFSRSDHIDAAANSYREILVEIGEVIESPEYKDALRYDNNYLSYTLSSKLGELESVQAEMNIDNFLENLDQNRWDIFRNNEAIRNLLPTGAIDRLEDAICEKYTEQVISGHPHTGDTITAGYKLLDFKGPNTIPLVILNGFREIGYSGEYPFIGVYTSAAETPLSQYISSLTPEDIDGLERSNVPGAAEAAILIKENPESFIQAQSYDSTQGKMIDNPIGEEVQRNLIKMAGHYLDSADPNLKFFAIGALDRFSSLPTHTYQKIVSQAGTPGMEKFSRAAAKMMSRKATQHEDPLALKALGQYLEKETVPQSRTAVLGELCSLAETVSKSIREERGLPPSDVRLKQEDELGSIAIKLLTKVEQDNYSPEAVLRLLQVFDQLEINPPELGQFISSEYLKNNVSEIQKLDSGGIDKDPLATLLVNRLRRFGDENSFSLLCHEMAITTNGLIRKNLTNSLTVSVILEDSYSYQERNKPKGEFELKMLERITGLLSSDDLALQRNAAQILSLVSNYHQSRPIQLSDKAQLPFFNEVQTRLMKSLPHFRDADPIVNFYKLLAEKNLLVPSSNSAEFLIGLFNNRQEIEQYEQGATGALLMLIKRNVADFSPDQALTIVKAGVPSEVGLLFCLQGKFSRQQEQELLTQGHIDRNLTLNLYEAPNLLDSSGQINSDNWMRLLTAFVMINGSEQRLVPESTKQGLVDLFSNPETKSLCLRKLKEMGQIYLQDATATFPPMQMMVLASAIEGADLPPNLKFVESYARLMKQAYKSFNKLHTAQRTRLEIKAALQNQETRLSKERWSEDDKASFYDISSDVIEAAPSLFSEYASLINNLSPDELKLFSRNFYPFYQAQLVIIQRGSQDNPTYDARQLVDFRSSIRSFKQNLEEAGLDGSARAKVFENQKDNLVQFLTKGFKERFGLIKVPESMDGEKIRSIQNFIRYLGNIAHRDKDKETMIALFLGLTLNGKWPAFRRGETISASDYFEGEQMQRVENYLKRREQLEPLSAEKLGLNPEEYQAFMTIAQDETANSMVGNVQTIDQKLGNVLRNLEDLADPDIYPPAEGRLLTLLVENGTKLVNTTIAKTWQQRSGRKITLSPAELEIQVAISGIESLDISSPESIKTLQERIKPLSLIANIASYSESEGVPGKITELQERLAPSSDVTEVFKKLGEDFTPHSGALALSQDLNYLENVIVKNDDKLEPEDKEKLTTYLGKIRTQMQVLEQAMQHIGTRFTDLKRSVEPTAQGPLQIRLAEIDRIINSRDEAISVVSRMTIDPNLIVENMRQCLGMLSQEINNDTNLTFGDTDKFFMISQTAGERGSIADQIIFFVPTHSRNEEAGGFSLVMDQLYGSKSSDVFTSHTLTVLKKYRQLHQQFPDMNLSVFVPEGALASGGMTSEILSGKLLAQMGDVLQFENKEVTVNIPQSASGDHYVEFGGNVRGFGDRTVRGVVIKLKKPA